MKLNISKKGMYIPTWNNNNELPEHEQIKIHFQRITGNMASQITSFSQNVNGQQQIYIDNAYIVGKCVYAIDNLFDTDGNQIKDGNELLLAVGVSGLVIEVGSHIFVDSRITPDLEKKNKDSNTLVQ